MLAGSLPERRRRATFLPSTVRGSAVRVACFIEKPSRRLRSLDRRRKARRWALFHYRENPRKPTRSGAGRRGARTLRATWRAQPDPQSQPPRGWTTGPGRAIVRDELLERATHEAVPAG